jgi:hypothetical protein
MQMSNVIKKETVDEAIKRAGEKLGCDPAYFGKEGEREVKKEIEKLTVTAPSYYTHGTIETWDFILDKGMNFLEGNVIKYVTRWREKNGVEDLKKARVYLDKLIEEAGKKNE